MKYSASTGFNMTKEFIKSEFPALLKANNPAYGVESDDDIRIEPVNIDELCYLLASSGTHMILFGGSWDESTSSTIDVINSFAVKYNVDRIHLFDWRLDGATDDFNIKTDITRQHSYIGPGKSAYPVNGAVFNYIYGEIVSRYLTNLNDWTDRKIGSGYDICYLDREYELQTVPDMIEPFLIIYDKDNTTDNSGSDKTGTPGCFPIVYAFEGRFFRGKDNIFYSDADKTVMVDYPAILEKSIFCHLKEDALQVSVFRPDDYIRQAFKVNGRGHAFKTEDAFKDDEKINIIPVTLRQMQWIFNQEGTFILMFGGPWCAFTAGSVATYNDFAVANDTYIYMLDFRLDSKHPVDFWFYPRSRECAIRGIDSPFRKTYVDLFEQYLPGAPITTSLNSSKHWITDIMVRYTDDEGKEHKALTCGVPYIFVYDKDHIPQRFDTKAPVIAVGGSGGELINTSENYTYYEPMYRAFKASVYYMFHRYCDVMGLDMKDIDIDRSAPIVSGKPQKHPEVQPVFKEHDWFKELAGRKTAPEDSDYSCSC